MFADMGTMSCRAVHPATITTAARLIDSICQAELRTKILISDNMEPGGAIVHCSRVGGEPEMIESFFFDESESEYYS